MRVGWGLGLAAFVALGGGFDELFLPLFSSAFEFSEVFHYLFCPALSATERLRGFSLAGLGLVSRLKVLSLWFAHLGVFESRPSNLFLLFFVFLLDYAPESKLGSDTILFECIKEGGYFALWRRV